MIRTRFYYIIDDVIYLFAVKHCIRPKQTKVYKHLIKLLDKNKVQVVAYCNKKSVCIKLVTLNY